jgi:hypothetical protein
LEEKMGGSSEIDREWLRRIQNREIGEDGEEKMAPIHPDYLARNGIEITPGNAKPKETVKQTAD